MKDKSDENWRVGLRCLREENCNSAANRLYYGLMQAALTYLTERKNYRAPEDGRVHGEVIRLMAFEREGERCRFLLSKFKILRETADYYKHTPARERIELLVDEAGVIREKCLREAGV